MSNVLEYARARIIDRLDSNEKVKVTDFFLQLVMDMFCRTMFGIDVDALGDSELFYAINSSLSVLFGYVFTSGFTIKGLLMPVPREVIEVKNTLLDCGKHLHDLRRDQLDHSGSDSDNHSGSSSCGKMMDFLTTYPFESDNLRYANIIVLLLGGYDTLGLTLSCALLELLKNPRCKVQVEEEISLHSCEKWSDMTYLNCCFKETLRLHPPGPLLNREADTDISYLDMVIPTGSRLIFSILACGRADWIERANEFVPERWLDDPVINPHYHQLLDLKRAFLTFGSGDRMCMGQVYTNDMGPRMLAHILNYFNCSLAPGSENVEVVHVDGLLKPLNFYVNFARRDRSD